MKAIAKHRTHSIEFKRQVSQEYISGETLHGLSKQHDLSRSLIRVWIEKFGGDIDGHNSYAQRGNLPVVEDVCEGGMALMPMIGRLRLLRSWGRRRLKLACCRFRGHPARVFP